MGSEWRETGDNRPEISIRRRDVAIATFAANRHRVASRSELIRLGLSSDQIKRRVADGRLVRRYRGIYVVGPGALTAQGEWLAAALFADGVVSHWDAATLSRLRDGSPRRPIHVTSPRRVDCAGVDAHRSRLAPDERTILHGVPTTTTGRTLLDCAALGAGPRDLERMLNEAWVLNLPIRPSLGEILARHPAHRGLVALRAAARSFHGPATHTRSELEEAYLALIDRQGLPRPLINHRIETRIGPVRVDCAWPAQRVAIELDAPSTHGSRPAMLRDRRRDRALLLAGWRTGRLMEEDLADEQALVDELTGLLDP